MFVQPHEHRLIALGHIEAICRYVQLVKANRTNDQRQVINVLIIEETSVPMAIGHTEYMTTQPRHDNHTQTPKADGTTRPICKCSSKGHHAKSVLLVSQPRALIIQHMGSKSCRQGYRRKNSSPFSAQQVQNVVRIDLIATLPTLRTQIARLAGT
jgi:hypothetical protein